MKKTLLLVIITIFNFQISQAQQTYTQQVPDEVSEIRLSEYSRLMVKPTSGPMMLQTYKQYQVATVKKGRLTIPGSSTDLTLLLPEGRSIAFVAEDYSNLTFVGSFGKRPKLTVHTKDYASALFSGSLADSVWAVNISLQAEDYSQIHSEVRMMQFGFEVLPEDYAHITIDCFQERYEPGMSSRSQTVRQCSNCIVNWNYCFSDTVENVGGDTAYSQYIRDQRSRVKQQGDSVKNAMSSRQPNRSYSYDGEQRSRSVWRHRDVALHFAWGFHNWGTSMFNGFEGVDGDAAVRTSFNNIQLSVDYPLVGTRHFGFYVGLGLEWDKYKFEANEVTLNTSTDPYAFSDGGDQSCSSWLNTRYVVVPLTFRFDLWHDWSLTLSALPGIHWGGSHTGLRREYDTDLEDRTERDQSINKYINPYKLDLRATLSYENIGLYFQLPTMSTFRSSVQELYPIKFGLILTLD